MRTVTLTTTPTPTLDAHAIGSIPQETSVARVQNQRGSKRWNRWPLVIADNTATHENANTDTSFELFNCKADMIAEVFTCANKPITFAVSDFGGTVHLTTSDVMGPAVGANRSCIVHRCQCLATLRYDGILKLAAPNGSHAVSNSFVGHTGDYVRWGNSRNDHSSTNHTPSFPPGYTWVKTDNDDSKLFSSHILFYNPVTVSMIHRRDRHLVLFFQSTTVTLSDRVFYSINHQRYVLLRLNA